MVKTEKAQFTKSHIGTHERSVIIGKTGSGKSVLFDTLLKFLAKKTLIILIDTKREYEHIPDFKLKFLKANKGLYRVYELRHRGKTIDHVPTVVEFISNLLFARKNCMLAIEEMSQATKKNAYRLGDIMPHLNKLLTQGRSRGVGFLGTSQRPQQVHTDFLSQADHIISFEVTSTHDLKAMRTYIDEKHYEGLKRFEFIHYNMKGNYLRHCYKLYLSKQEKAYYESIFGKY